MLGKRPKHHYAIDISQRRLQECAARCNEFASLCTVRFWDVFTSRTVVQGRPDEFPHARPVHDHTVPDDESTSEPATAPDDESTTSPEPGALPRTQGEEPWEPPLHEITMLLLDIGGERRGFQVFHALRELARRCPRLEVVVVKSEQLLAQAMAAGVMTGTPPAQENQSDSVGGQEQSRQRTEHMSVELLERVLFGGGRAAVPSLVLDGCPTAVQHQGRDCLQRGEEASWGKECPLGGGHCLGEVNSLLQMKKKQQRTRKMQQAGG